jgi:uncharacterized RDD family membrane protein YckC
MTDKRPLAGLIRRPIATIIDFILVPVFGFLFMLVSGAMEHAEAYAGNQMIIRPIMLGIASYLLVNGWLLFTKGQTIGKALMGLTILSDKTNQKASLQSLLLRALFFPTLYLLIPAILGMTVFFLPWLALLVVIDQIFIFGKKRQCLHDVMCGTNVVR